VHGGVAVGLHASTLIRRHVEVRLEVGNGRTGRIADHETADIVDEFGVQWKLVSIRCWRPPRANVVPPGVITTECERVERRRLT
jgi:hypothetical protein